MATQIQITNLPDFLASVREAQRLAGDLTIPLSAIGRDWMRTNLTIFQLSGPGPWADLSGGRSGRDKKGRFRSVNGGYKAEKLKRWGFVYPILEASGALKRSLTEPGDSGSLFEIINGQTLLLGTRVAGKDGANYPAFLRDGTKFMPARNYTQIPRLSVERWKLILKKFVLSRTASTGGGRATGR